MRVDAERLDSLMHLMGELVIHRTAVDALTAGLDVPGPPAGRPGADPQLAGAAGDGHAGPHDPRRHRLPALPAAGARPRDARLGKEVKLELVGSDTELDRTVVDAIGDPLVHLVRNARRPRARAARRARGGRQAEPWTISIAARHAGGSVIIEVRDDGRGIDPAAVGQQGASLAA